MENKEFDTIFQSLKDREITPSSNALKLLQEGLNEADRKNKRKKPMFIWWAAATVAILISLGITMFPSDKMKEMPSSVALPEVKSIEIVEPEKYILDTQVAETNESVETEVENLEIETYVIPEIETAPEINSATQIASGKEVKDVEEVKQKDIIEKESVLLEDTSNLDKRLVELLKPVEDAELDALLKQEQVAIALEEIDDTTILQLLREAQMELQAQENMSLASSQTDKLLQQAEMELKANKSLRNIFNKALEAGIVQVETLFKSE